MTTLKPVWYSNRSSQAIQKTLIDFNVEFPRVFDFHERIELEFKKPKTEQEKARYHDLMDKLIKVKQASQACETLPIEHPPYKPLYSLKILLQTCIKKSKALPLSAVIIS